MVIIHRIGTIGSGSDFTGFLQFLGVSCMDITYVSSLLALLAYTNPFMLFCIQVNLSSGGYPVYHSVHDNFYWMTNFGDPSFTHHKALGLLWSKAAVMLMTTPVLPYDPRDYAITLEQIYNTFVSEYGKALDDQKITLGEAIAMSIKPIASVLYRVLEAGDSAVYKSYCYSVVTD